MASVPFHILTSSRMYFCSRKSLEKPSFSRFWSKLNTRKVFFLIGKQSQYPVFLEKYCWLLLSRVSEIQSSHHVTTKTQRNKTSGTLKTWNMGHSGSIPGKGWKSWGNTRARSWETLGPVVNRTHTSGREGSRATPCTFTEFPLPFTFLDFTFLTHPVEGRSTWNWKKCFWLRKPRVWILDWSYYFFYFVLQI